jgi:hypothetical protein
VLLRTLLALGNLAGFVVLGLILFAYPRLDTGPVVYVLLGYLLGSIVVIYGPWGNRVIGRGRAPASAAPPAPSHPRTGSTGPGDLPFCIYCAAPLPVGAAVCPACGHARPHP